MGKEFFGAEDKKQKLNGTICMYKGSPVYVQAERDDDTTVTIQNLTGKNLPKKIKYTDEEFDYLNIPLGYLNYGQNAMYLSRQPARQYYQGLRAEYIMADGPRQHYVADYFMTSSMVSCILGDHPTFHKALEAVVDGEAQSRAFSRHLSVSREERRVGINYRGRLIGHKQVSGDAFVLMPTGEYSYLKMILEKHGVEVC
jgi:hypothetical protein